MAGTAAAQVEDNQTESSQVTVNVAETIAVDVQPANLDYSNAVVGQRNTSSDRGFNAIEIENTGSTNIDRLWLNNSVPVQDPFGTGTSSNYDAGNFIQIQPASGEDLTGDTDDWHFINRKEYLWSSNANGNADDDVPEFIQIPGWTNYEVGQFRRGNESIYFAIQEGSSDTCNGGSAVIRVGNVSTTDNRLGTVDFTSSTEEGWVEYQTNSLTNSDYGFTTTPGSTMVSNQNGVALNWSTTKGDTAEGDKPEYEVLMNCDPSSEQPHVFRTRYNINALGADDLTQESGSAVQYLIDQATESAEINPGGMRTLFTAVEIPEGVTEGGIGNGKLRVMMTADPDEN